MMNIDVDMYRYQNFNFYTGTEYQPDLLTVFIKSKRHNYVQIYQGAHLIAPANALSLIPVISSFTGIAVIVSAVKRFFQELVQIQFKADNPHLLECWNAIKNFFRGLVSLVPIIGNITLIIFEAVRIYVIDRRIKNALEEEENIAGIALDGKILFKLPLDQLHTLYSERKTDAVYLAGFKELSLEYLKREGQRDGTLKITELLPRIEQLLIEKGLTQESVA